MAGGGINKVIILGRVGADPEVKYTPSNIAMCRLSIATSSSWNDKSSGEKKEKTEWHRVVLWNKLAEIAEKYVKKGNQIYIEGRLETTKYEKDGVDRWSTSIIASSMEMLGKGGESATDSSSSFDKSNQGSDQSSSIPNDQEFDDDIPF